nr:MAG TPA: hypothetical protein [Caudoviricetes sp.]
MLWYTPISDFTLLITRGFAVSLFTSGLLLFALLFNGTPQVR